MTSNLDLDLNTVLKLVSAAPFRLRGYCRAYTPSYQEHHFLIAKVDGGYELTGENYSQVFHDLKEAIQGAYLEWGE